MRQFNIEALVKAVNGNLIHKDVLSRHIQVNNVSIDSRTIENHDIFIPIVGENFDGHDFIKAAYERGAYLSFTEDETKIPPDRCGIHVKDTKQALKDFAMYYLTLFQIPVIAVTGSVGKTSCKEMIASVLSAKFLVHKTRGNFNNEIGLPLTLFKLEDYHQCVVLEMGMNHYGEIHRLSEIAKPDIAVITNIGEAHIENLGSKDGILKAKSEILDFLKDDGLVILNGDDPYLRKLMRKIRFKTVTFGFNKQNDYYIKDYRVLGWEGICAHIASPIERYAIRINTLGKHMLYNVIPGIIIGHYLGMDVSQIETGITKYKPAKMRMNKLLLNRGIVVINDAYNASVDSMRSAMETLAALDTDGRKVAILGDMFEMGDHAKMAHEQVGEIASKHPLDLLVCVGKDAKYIYESGLAHGIDNLRIRYYPSKEKLMNDLEDVLKEKDTIIVKASRGMYLENVIEAIKEATNVK
ncbi:UDP-N-acetylmuramoyl-tripeptide--D-alanyl-D-alanine ligase [Vallitalea pronyensis]|uniref:UDP-N-acetylmuramoyl-tripeptide--D-alanyl-D-alanine ligase n=1 Tax=Vallitalea pronyensis TaxID=1348613 RepID=A0A8J8MKA1_9FIRM|nr:UDP-N-acetylmuramoyl-tripeptide--D-alanyl-D-alanine ligase [Vallitalea pronyensis]QUI23205.1 UDP-N-acetylmuramoyl-tripeptide--D-alanyl-D-alanine ligase [Vallitalea pronyensis]